MIVVSFSIHLKKGTVLDRVCRYCVVIMEEVLINITDGTDLKPMSKICVFQLFVCQFSSSANKRTN